MIIDRRVAFPELKRSALAGSLTFLATVDEALTPGSLQTLARLEQIAIMTTVSGACRTRLGDHEAPQRRGNLIWMFPGADLCHEVVGAQPWRCRYAVLAGPLVDPAIQAMRTRGTRLAAFTPASAAWLAQLHELVDAGLRQHPGWDWDLLRALAILLEGLHDRPPSVAHEPLRERVARIIDQSIEHAWSLDDIARHLSMSRSALSAAWSAQGGETLMAWTRQRRLQRARVLLEQGMAVGDVADLLHFSSAFAFSRAYRACHRAPPSAHRRKHSALPWEGLPGERQRSGEPAR